jgi:heat shock protein HslJ
MKRFGFAVALVALAACGRTSEVPADLTGRWEVQQIAGASLGEGVDIWIEIDATTGAMHGFTGCNNFTATMSGFTDSLAVGAITEEPGECADQAASTDETRFLAVLPHVQRRIRRGNSLELLEAPSGSETLIRLRLAEPVGG